MTKGQIAAELKRIASTQLDDCERAIKGGERKIALNELQDAMRRLKRLATMLGEPPSRGGRPATPRL